MWGKQGKRYGWLLPKKFHYGYGASGDFVSVSSKNLKQSQRPLKFSSLSHGDNILDYQTGDIKPFRKSRIRDI